MATLGTGGPKESTEWDDILRSKGIIPEKSVDELANDVLKTMVEEKVDNFDPHANKSVSQLNEDLEDADSDEGMNFGCLWSYGDADLAIYTSENRLTECRAALILFSFSFCP